MDQVEATIANDGEKERLDQFKKQLVSEIDEPPVYEIVPVLETTSISPGEEIKLNLYLTGKGMPTKSKVSVNYAGIPVDTSRNGRVEFSIHAGVSGEDFATVSGENFVSETSFPDHEIGAFVTGLNPLYFTDNPEAKEELQEYHFSPTMAETEHGGVPPIKIIIPTRESIDPGTYKITSSLVYERNDVTPSVTKQAVEVEVQDWVDRNRRQLRKAAIAIASIAVLVSIIQIVI